MNHISLNETELKLKQLYTGYPSLHLTTPRSPEEFIKLSGEAQFDLQQLLPIPSVGTLQEETFIPKEEDIAIFQHLRYLPPIYHNHDFFEMLYVVNGKCINHIHDTDYPLESGDICIIAPMLSHAVSAFSNDAVIYNFLIRTSTFDTAFLGLLSDRDVLSSFFTHALYSNKQASFLIFRTGNDTSLRDFIHYAYTEYTGSKKYKRRMLNNVLHAIFILLLRNHEQDVIIPSITGRTPDDNLILIMNYIQVHYPHITLAELAGFFNYSERHMSRLIKEHTGKNFGELIRELKLHKAADLLNNPNISIADIIDSVGYADISSFYRTFKNYYGVTPIEYRKQNCPPA